MSKKKATLEDLIDRADTLLQRFERLVPAYSSDCPHGAHAFTWHPTRGAVPLHWNASTQIDDLLHVDRQKQALLQNTEQFLSGLPANNALLWGSRGTGKSSLTKAVMRHFTPHGLRVIEIGRDQIENLAQMLQWAGSQKHYFIVYCDDLSFERDESRYKTIKALIDGSIVTLPPNVLLYATSNRRHLIPELMQDNQQTRHQEGQIHYSETIEETISLSDRFGLWLSFHPFDQQQYLATVDYWLQKFGMETEEEEYREAALRWALERGSRSGRIANQFARAHAGAQRLAEINADTNA